MIIGAIFGTLVGVSAPAWPGWIVITLALLAGFLGGALWGAIPGALKAYFSVNEILSTVMLNAIAVQIMNYLLRGPMIDPVQLERASRIPQTARLAEAFRLPRLAPTRLHLGAGIAVVLAVLVYILLWRTTLGYRIRAVGQNAEASRYAGIKPATANDLTLFELSRDALVRVWTRRVRIRHMRLIFDRLVFPPAQLALFPVGRKEMQKRTNLIAAIDKIRDHFGPEAIRMGRMLAV